ncbi:flagellar hook-basal body protein [Shewanella woodyi]|uniref:flagellar hook-basal body protein n=1 Tax=Shewanella woodyi TaxID=60961 RepID=UPI003747A875
MIDALYIAESGLDAKQKQLDSIAHNIANVSTPGYKTSQMNFLTVVQEERNSVGDILNSQGLGVMANQSALDMTAGKMEQTGRALDIAINGAGFIEVEQLGGKFVYSRGGRLSTDSQGYLSTENGFRLASMLQIPPDAENIHISSDGVLSAKLFGDNSIEIGQIQLVNFTDMSAVKAVGNNLFEADKNALNSAHYGSAGEGGMGKIQQGMLESSNVSMNQEMMNMMMAQRSYQLNARLVQVSDQILETLNNLRR